MINENAPGVLLLSVGQVLDDKDQAQIKELKAKTTLEVNEKEQIENLYNKYENAVETFHWIPIPVNTKGIPLVSTSYEASANRSVDMMDSKAFLTNLTDTQTITFMSDTTVFSNALIFMLDYMFQLDTARASLQYYSDELVFGKSYLVKYLHNFDMAKSQHSIKITVQKSSGDPVGKLLKKTKVLTIK